MQAMISKWLPAEERSRYSALIWAGENFLNFFKVCREKSRSKHSFSGAQAGTVVAMPISGILAADVSWESVFYFFGVLGVIWFIFWAFLCFDSPAKHPRISSVILLIIPVVNF
jgi:MFS family permease